MKCPMCKKTVKLDSGVMVVVRDRIVGAARITIEFPPHVCDIEKWRHGKTMATCVERSVSEEDFQT